MNRPPEAPAHAPISRRAFLAGAMTLPFAFNLQRVLAEEKIPEQKNRTALTPEVRKILEKHGTITYEQKNPKGTHPIICMTQLHAIPCDALRDPTVLQNLYAHHQHMYQCLQDLDTQYPTEGCQYLLEAYPSESFRQRRRSDFLRGIDRIQDMNATLEKASHEERTTLWKEMSESGNPYAGTSAIDAGNRFAAAMHKRGKASMLEGDVENQSVAYIVNSYLQLMTREEKPDLSDATLQPLIQKWLEEEREILVKRHKRYVDFASKYAENPQNKATCIVLGKRHFTEDETADSFFGRAMKDDEKSVYLLHNALQSIPNAEIVLMLPKGWKEYDDLMQKFFKNPPKDRPAGFMKPIPALTPQDVRDMVEHMRNHKQGACRYQGMAYIC